MAEPAFTVGVGAIFAAGSRGFRFVVRFSVHFVYVFGGLVLVGLGLCVFLEPYAESLVEERNVFLGQRLAQDLGLFGLGREG